ncbi:hypothetical protein FNF28_06632 [Cafeteria roenbergensis]|uniref:AMP-dependent synthetase/ligase domain-containing protein n=1 Tax=Cafeteria roenbergensis TaxID=33653 RepID=A0A5A8CTV9_CAFRO|nr:hypothetical protein FNF28_06632 [Cafeteria roenbergensis]
MPRHDDSHEVREGLLAAERGDGRPSPAFVESEFVRVGSRDAVARNRTCAEKCTGTLIGLVIAVGIAAALGIAAAVDSTASLEGWQIALGAALALVSLVAVPCLYTPGLPKETAFPKATPVALTGATRVGQTLPYRSTRVDTLSTTKRYAAGTATTLREMWDLTSAAHAGCSAFGRREEVDRYVTTKRQRTDDGEVVKKFRRVVLRNEFSFLTYAQANARIVKLARGVESLLQTHHSAGAAGSDPRHAAIFAATRVEWQLSAQACFRAGVPLATVYNTLGKDGLAYAVNLTEATVLFVEGATLAMVADVANGGAVVQAGSPDESEMDLSCVKCVVLLDEPHSPDVDAKKLDALRTRSDARGGPMQVVSLAELEEIGDKPSAPEPPAPTPEDTAVIMFTSGSTGLPKGVVVLHRNLVACAVGLGDSLPNLCSDDIWLAYLPSSHILELAAELCFVSAGGALGYGSPFTLTSGSPSIPQPGDVDESGRPREADVVGDAVALRPTIIACVPAVVARIRKGVMGTVNSTTGLRKWLATYALKTSTAAFSAGKSTPFLDGLVFDGIRTKVLGGNVRAIASGGGPLSADAQVWMNVVMQCPMRQGYGLTETCGGGTLQWMDDRSTARVGPPILSNDIKLVDWEEGGYVSSGATPQGEICICGGNVTAGYYREPEKTAESFVEEADGRIWFRTGDVGQFDPDGVLRIIDRKKDLVKLERGEYISLGKMESVFSGVEGVANIVCYGNSSKMDSVAVVIVDEAGLPEAVRRGSERSYIGDREVAAHIKSMIAAKAREAKFANKGEIPAHVFIGGSTAWLPASGLVTASMKLQRKKVDRYYDAAYKFLYGDGPDPSAALAAAAPAHV